MFQLSRSSSLLLNQATSILSRRGYPANTGRENDLDRPSWNHNQDDFDSTMKARFDRLSPLKVPPPEASLLDGDQTRWYFLAMRGWTNLQLKVLADILDERIRILNRKVDANLRKQTDDTIALVAAVPSSAAFERAVADRVENQALPLLMKALRADPELRKLIREIVNDDS